MQTGQVIRGKYRLVRLVGDGGMGSVFEAHHEMLGTRVAVKFLHTELARHPGLSERFLQEARVAAQIKSPHVVQVTDIDQTPEGFAYIVMELLEGEALSSVLERDRKLAVSMSCEYTRQILEALEAAHALGVVHRDLKPENVFVTFSSGKPVIKLIDFGIAKLKRADVARKNLTIAGVLMGTAEYMAPEQAFSADKVDARSDIYSVGVMLYEMIAGTRPVSGDDARVIAAKVERGEITPLVHVLPDVPREIAGLAHRAMAARPELRFASAAEMRLALEGVLSGKRPPTVPLPVGNAAQVEAGTGTVMGAPAQALLGAHAAPITPGYQAIGGGTARVTPIAAAPFSPNPVVETRPRRRSSSAWLIGLALILGVAAVGAIVVSQSDALREPTPAATAVATAAPLPKVPPSGPSAVPTTPISSDPLAPLVTPPVRPPPPTAPRPHPSAAPSSSPDTPPAVSPFPSIPLPFPIPSGSAPVFTIPTTLPSGFPPIPFPGFAPQPVPNAPEPAPSTPGY